MYMTYFFAMEMVSFGFAQEPGVAYWTGNFDSASMLQSKFIS